MARVRRLRVDGAYLYDVPQAEVTAFRWPPSSLYAIPHWVGDTVQVPPFDIPFLQFKFKTRDNIGFRINGEPLPNSGLTSQHRYQITIIGDGNPITFQILDSAFSISAAKIIPRYDDNSGSLSVQIEERPYLNICSVKPICISGRIAGLSISAALLNYSSDSTGRPRNMLTDPSQIGLAIDGKFICPDSISCSGHKPGGSAYALVFDRSGSMNDPYNGSGITKLVALKTASLNFLKTLRQGDSVLLITFANQASIKVDWTSDTAIIASGIRNISATGGTAYRDAAYMGIEQTARHYSPNKTVILLTDGEDNSSVRTETEVVNKSHQFNIPVYAIGVSLNAPQRDS